MPFRFQVVRLPPHRAQIRGLGQSVETPELRPLPWQLDRAPDPRAAKLKARKESLGTAATLVALVGGALGIAGALRR